jgi:hypothetical protein
MRRLLPVLLALPLAACAVDAGQPDETGASTDETDQALTGCHGKASSSIPGAHQYVLTTFGATKGDDGIMSCGSYTKHGSWWYAASRQRYGCGAHVKIEANGKCVVAQTDDYGPDVCVETAAKMPVMDASPLVSKALFGASSLGWSDHRVVRVTPVSRAVALGPCK